jgi:hypothetical protein
MFPWLWLWAPQLHLPLSGDVAQRIDPVTHLFFRGIAPSAGDATIEEQAFGVASYGKQLGLITDVLLDLARRAGTESPEAADSLAKLEDVAARIEALKTTTREQVGGDLDDIEARVRDVRRQGGAGFTALQARLRPLLEGAA